MDFLSGVGVVGTGRVGEGASPSLGPGGGEIEQRVVKAGNSTVCIKMCIFSLVVGFIGFLSHALRCSSADAVWKTSESKVIAG